MSKTIMTAAFAAMLAASPVALAQTTAMTPTANVTTGGVEPGQIRGTDMKGSDVYDSQNNKVGSIRDMILDRSGRVAAVVLDVEGKNVAVGMQDLQFAMNDNNKPKTITIDKNRNELKSEAPFDLNADTSR